MAPFEALYGKACRTPLCWTEVGERPLVGPEIVDTTNANIQLIKANLKVAQDRQKSIADKHSKDREFTVGDFVFLKLSPWKCVVRFGKRGKLSPRYVGPYQIIERICAIAYKLELPLELSLIHNIFHVSMLQKYVPDPSHIIQIEPLEVNPNASYVEEPVAILSRQDKVLRNKVIPLVKNPVRKPDEFRESTQPFSTTVETHSGIFPFPSFQLSSLFILVLGLGVGL
nr:uncharacterized protein LOC114823369 [Malus domestica]